MIIECGECLTKFVVAPEAIGPEGRAVRCAKCQHVWHAEPAPEDHEIVPTEVIKKADATPEPKPSPEPDMAALSEPQGESQEKVDVKEDFDIADTDSDGATDSDDGLGDDALPGEDLGGESEEFKPIDDSLDDEDDDLDDDDDINLPVVVPVKSRLIKVAWVLWVVLVVGTVATFGLARPWVEQTWPASAVIYDLVGMSVDDEVKPVEEVAEKPKTEAVKEPEVKKPSREELERAVVITNSFQIETIGGGRRDLVINGTLRNSATYEITLPELKGVLKNAGDENILEWRFTASAKILKAGASLDFKTVVQRIPDGTAAYELFLLWGNDP